MIKLIKEGYDDTYYEVVSEVDGIPNTIVRKDDDVKFRVVRRNNKNGYQIKAMWYDKDQKMGQWDYSKEYYDTPEEASDAMTKFTATFRNLPKEINESITETDDLLNLENFISKLKYNSKNMTNTQYYMLDDAYMSFQDLRNGKVEKATVVKKCREFAEYCETHNKNLTKKQDYLIDDILTEIHYL